MNKNISWEEKVSFFIELGKPLSKAKTIKKTIDTVMYQVGKIFQPVNWSLLLKDSKSDNMIFSVVIGNNKDKLQGRKLPKGEGIAGHIFSTGEPLIIQKVDNDKRFSQRVDKYTGFTTTSIIGVPLKTDKAIFGVIELINKIGGKDFTSVELKILSSIAEYAAIAIERSYYNQSLKKMAFFDPLTGLKNKNSFNHALSNRMNIFNRYKTVSTLLFVNIMDFRKINEKKGHQAGERLLVKLTDILKQSVRKVDELFRYEADQFIILMPQTEVSDTGKIKNRINNQLEYLNSLYEKDSFQINMDVHTIDPEKSKNVLDLIHNNVYQSRDTISHMYTEPFEDNIQVMLEDEKKAMPPEEKKKTRQGKKVSLSGTFIHYNKQDHGNLTILSVSSLGVSFKTPRSHTLKKDDLLNVVFSLDDTNRSLIKRQVTIQNIDKNNYEATFYNPPPYDKNFGFYLMS